MGFGFTVRLMVDARKKRRYCANSIALVKMIINNVTDDRLTACRAPSRAFIFQIPLRAAYYGHN